MKMSPRSSIRFRWLVRMCENSDRNLWTNFPPSFLSSSHHFFDQVISQLPLSQNYFVSSNSLTLSLLFLTNALLLSRVFFLYLSLSLSLTVSYFLSHSLFSFAQTNSCCLAFSLSLSLSLTVSYFLSLFLSLSLLYTHCLRPSSILTVFVTTLLSVYHSLNLSIFLSHSLTVCITLFLSFAVTLSFPLKTASMAVSII